MNIEDLEASKRVMNKVMMKYVEQVRMDPSVYIRDRNWYNRLLNRAPMEILANNKPVMFKDRWSSFSKTLMMAMDFDFLMLDVVIICFMDRQTIS